LAASEKHPPEEHPARRAHAGGVGALAASEKHPSEEHPGRRAHAGGVAALAASEKHPPEENPAHRAHAGGVAARTPRRSPAEGTDAVKSIRQRNSLPKSAHRSSPAVGEALTEEQPHRRSTRRRSAQERIAA